MHVHAGPRLRQRAVIGQNEAERVVIVRLDNRDAKLLRRLRFGSIEALIVFMAVLPSVASPT